MYYIRLDELHSELLVNMLWKIEIVGFSFLWDRLKSITIHSVLPFFRVDFVLQRREICDREQTVVGEKEPSKERFKLKSITVEGEDPAFLLFLHVVGASLIKLLKVC